jgi:hypothetical protein
VFKPRLNHVETMLKPRLGGLGASWGGLEAALRPLRGFFVASWHLLRAPLGGSMQGPMDTTSRGQKVVFVGGLLEALLDMSGEPLVAVDL